MNSERPFSDGRHTVVFVLDELVAGTPTTNPWRERIRAFDAAGWATHAVFINADPALPRTTVALQTDGPLPPGTGIHHFTLRDRRIRPAWWAPIAPGESITPVVGDWLDWLTGQVPGAAVVVDEPTIYAYVAAITNPVVARIATIPDDPGALSPAAGQEASGQDSVDSAWAAFAEHLAAFESVVVPNQAVADEVRSRVGSRPATVVMGPATASSSAEGSSAYWGQWVQLAGRAADKVCNHRRPSLVVESITTSTRVLRLPGILADSVTGLSSWSCELPGLAQPAGWLVDVPAGSPTASRDEDDPPIHPHAAGPTREVVGELRSNALAFVATQTGPFRIDFTDGTTTVPLLATAFDTRLIASRAGNATISRKPDGTLWVSALDEVLLAYNSDGRLLVRIGANGTPSDITHALRWGTDIDWADLTPIAQGLKFTGVLRATGIAPSDGSLPAICVTDVGGFCRPVGALRYTGEPTIDGRAWSRPVAGVLEADPLAATTKLAGGTLSLHMGFRGVPEPVGGVWARGHRSPMHLTCPRGMVTLLPSPGGRVLVAPGRGYRTRVSGAVRRAVSRG